MTTKQQLWKVWDKWHTLPDHVYNDISRFVADVVQNKKALVVKEGPLRLLECGIGTGVITIPLISRLTQLIEKPIEVSGFDRETSKFPFLQARIADNNLKHIVKYCYFDIEDPSDIRQIMPQINKFDMVTSLWFLHYLKDPARFLHNLGRVLRRESLLFIGVSGGDIGLITAENSESGNGYRSKDIFFAKVATYLLDQHESVIDYNNLAQSRGFDFLTNRSFRWSLQITSREMLYLYRYRLAARPRLQHLSDSQLSVRIKQIERELGHELLESTMDLTMELKLSALEGRMQ